MSGSVVEGDDPSVGVAVAHREHQGRRANLSLVGRNLFFLMNNAEGFDPEMTAGSQNTTVGLESFSLPSTRSIGVNLNIAF